MTSCIELTLMRCAVNPLRCVFGSECKQKLMTVPKEKRYEILKKNRIYIPKRAKICDYHHQNGDWENYVNLEFKYSRDQIEDMIDLLRKPMDKKNEQSCLFASKNFEKNTGISMNQFNELFQNLPTLHQLFRNDNKKAKNALFLYLYRLRRGEFYYRIFDKFLISHVTGKSYITKARIALKTDFVPKNLGFNSIQREALIRSVSNMAKELYLKNKNNKAVIILDGTYVYCNKTQNYSKQRELYSTHKCRNLFKPMVFVTTTGQFIEVFGPFKALDNDATITKTIFDKYLGPINAKLEPGDVFLLDRGFRDVAKHLTDKGYDIKMPEFIEKKKLGQNQLTTAQANSSRIVTACRFAVETRNGHMKQIWQIFNRTLITYDLPNAMTDFRIGASLINKYYVTFGSNKYDAENIARKMLEKHGRQNEFAVIVDSSLFNNSVKNFVSGDLNFSFPKLQKTDFRMIALGNYQPKVAMGYIYEQTKLNEFEFFSSPKNFSSSVQNYKALVDKYKIKTPAIVLAIFKSRFRSKGKHRVYILIDQSILQGREGIISYYCDCAHGRRLVGCCSHVLAFIAYLSYYRHNTNEIKGSSMFINKFFDEVQPTAPES